MSKRDIETVCTLAAHLAQRTAEMKDGQDFVLGMRFIRAPHECAADAMRLQRLGRRTRRMYESGHGQAQAFGRKRRDVYEESQDIIGTTDRLLKPYGLCCIMCECHGLQVKGLPGNTAGGDGEGFDI